jgi:hypothetical protein
VITQNIETTYAFLKGIQSDEYDYSYLAHNRGYCFGELGFEYEVLFNSKRILALAKIIERIEYTISVPGRLQYISMKIFFLRSFWKADEIELHLVYNVIPLKVVKLISLFKKTKWYIHDETLFTGHCITSYGCGKNKVGCGKCPDLNRTLPIKFDRTRKNFLRNRKFVLSFRGVFVFSNKNFKEKMLSNQYTTKFIAEIKKIRVLNSSKFYGEIKDYKIHIGVYVSDRFEKNDLFLNHIIANLQNDNVVFHAIGAIDKNQKTRKYKNIIYYNQVSPWDVPKILNKVEFFFIFSVAESFGLLFAESIMHGAIPILITDSPIVDNFNLKFYQKIDSVNDLHKLIFDLDDNSKLEIKKNYVSELNNFYE